MPLHDWSKLPEWEGVHHLWISELYRDIKAKLPAGYRAGLATVPGVTVGGPATHPDVRVQRQPPGGSSPAAIESSPDDLTAYDSEVTVLALDPNKLVQVFRGTNLVAVLELISPRNKDRESSRMATVERLVGYLALGIHVLYVDVHSLPAAFSLADAIAAALDYSQPTCPSPQAMAYRVGGPADGGGSRLAFRRAPLTIGQPLPAMELPLSETLRVPVNLDGTYTTATSDYLSWLPSFNGQG